MFSRLKKKGLDMEIKINCPDCSKEIKVKIHKVVKLENEIKRLTALNEHYRNQIISQKKQTTNDMPDFFKGIFNK